MPASGDYVAIVVAATDKFERMSRAAVEPLGGKLGSVRAVKTAAREFASKIAGDPTPLSVKMMDVVGFREAPHEHGDLEPFVLHDGKPTLVWVTYLMVAGDYWVGRRDEVVRQRKRVVASIARSIAEDAFWCDAMMMAIDNADPECSLTRMSCEAATRTVEIDGDTDGNIAKRLPKWIKVKGGEETEP